MVKNHSFVIMGCKHCGKSTHGKAVAAKLGLEFFDLDCVIEKLTGMPVRQYYKQNGAAGFMIAEENACKRIISYANEKNCDIVISTGGGICDNSPALSTLRVCNSFVFLRLDINDSVDRIMANIEETEKGEFTNLPAYVIAEKPKSIEDVRNILVKTFTNRAAIYEKIADIIIDIKNAPIDENTDIILRAIQ